MRKLLLTLFAVVLLGSSNSFAAYVWDDALFSQCGSPFNEATQDETTGTYIAGFGDARYNVDGITIEFPDAVPASFNITFVGEVTKTENDVKITEDVLSDVSISTDTEGKQEQYILLKDGNIVKIIFDTLYNNVKEVRFSDNFSSVEFFNKKDGIILTEWDSDVIKLNLYYYSKDKVYQSHHTKCNPKNAIDGNIRVGMAGWQDGELHDVADNTLTKDSNWWAIDLGYEMPVDAIKIYFEDAYGTAFDIEFYDKDKQLLSTESITNNNTVNFSEKFDSTRMARYVRLNFLGATFAPYGIKFFQVELFAKREAFEKSTISATPHLVKGVPMPVAFSITLVVNGKTLTFPVEIESVSALPEGMTFKDGKFTAADAGTSTTTVVFNGLNYDVKIIVDDADNLVNVEGDFAPVVLRKPDKEYLKGNDYKGLFTNSTSEFGWDNFAELTSSAYYEMNLKNTNTIRAILLGHTNATISGFDVKFYESDGTTQIGETYSYTNSGAAGTTQILDFPEEIKGVQYIRLYPTALSTTYGAAICDFIVFGKAELMIVEEVVATPLAKVAMIEEPVKIQVDVIFNTGATIKDIHYDVVKLPSGLTYNSATGEFTSSVAGDMTFTIKLSGDEFKDVTREITINFKDFKCLFINNNGYFDTDISYDPAEGTSDSNYLIDEDVPADINVGGGGWGDNVLGTDKVVSDGIGLIYFDLKRKCTVEAARFVHANGTINKFDIKFYSSDPRKNADAKPLYTYSEDISELPEDDQTKYSDIILFDAPVKDVRYMVVDVKQLRKPEWGARFREICLYGTGEDIDDKIDHVEPSGYYVIKNDGSDQLMKSIKAYNKSHVLVYEISNVTVTVPKEYESVLTAEGAVIKAVAGAPTGVYPVEISYIDPATNESKTYTENIEVVTANWSNRYNIARYNITTGYDNDERKEKGKGFGNPFAKAFNNSSTKGEDNQVAMNIINGDWHAWNISSEEVHRTDGKPQPSLYLDLGFSLPVNEVAIYYNALADDEDVNSYKMMRPRNYTIYGGNAKTASSAMRKADGEVPLKPTLTTSLTGDDIEEMVDWTPLVYVTGIREEDYGAPGRHAWNLDEGETYRYLKFEFNEVSYEGLDISITEIAVGGDQLQDVEGNPNKTIEEATTVLTVETPNFDRSNVGDRGIVNDWVVTSSRVNENHPFHLSYIYANVFGLMVDIAQPGDTFNYYYVPDGVEVKLEIEAFVRKKEITKDTDGEEKVTYTMESVDAVEISRDEKDTYYHYIHWPKYLFDWVDKDNPGYAIVKAVAYDENGDKVHESEPLTVLVVSTRGNINRFANAYDNAVQYSANWNVPGAPDQKKGDRDLEAIGTDPSNAADGNYGSWYVIGYYGPGDHMGETYKYKADTVLEHPYELYMDYRSEDEVNSSVATTWADEVDMLGFRYEGDFPRDYNVYILTCDDDGNVYKNDDGTDRWEKVGTFENMQTIGTGQHETHRIFPADEYGNPNLDEYGNLIPWENVVAVKVEFKKLGTEWGIKLFESAIYGRLNHYVVTSNVEQLVYNNPNGFFRGKDDEQSYLTKEGVKNEKYLLHRKEPLLQEAGLYYSFNLKLSTDDILSGAYNDVYTDLEIEEMKRAFNDTDHYVLRISKRKVMGYNIIDGTPAGEQEDGTYVENGIQWTDSRFVYADDKDVKDDYSPRVFILDNNEERNKGRNYEPYFVELASDQSVITPEGFLEITIPAFGLIPNEEDGYTPVKDITDLVIQNVEPTYYYRIAGIDAKDIDGNTVKALEFAPSERVRMVAPYVKYDVHSESFGFYAEKNESSEDGQIDFEVNDSEWTTNEESGHHLGSVAGTHYATYTHANRVSLLGEFTQLMLTQQTLDAWDLYYQVDVEVNVNDEKGDPIIDNEGNIDPNFNRVYRFDGTFDSHKKIDINNKPINAPLTYLPLPVEQVALDPDNALQSVQNVKVNRIRNGVQYMVKTTNRVTYVHPFHHRITLARTSVDSTTNLNLKKLTDQIIPLDAQVIPYKRAFAFPDEPHKRAMFGVKFTPRTYEFVSDTETPPFSYIGFHASNPYHESETFDDEEAPAQFGRPAGWDEYKYGVPQYCWGEDNGISNFSKKAIEFGHMGICLEKVADAVTEPQDIEDAYVAITAEYPIILGYYTRDKDENGTEKKTFHSHPAIYLPDQSMRWAISTDAEEGDYIVNGELVKNPEETDDTPAEAPRRKADGDVVDPDHYDAHQYQTLSTGKVYAVDFEGAETTTSVTEIAKTAAGTLKAWPVPAVNTVNLAAATALGDIEIYAVDGTLVKKEATGDTSIKLDISALTPGIYVVHAAGTSTRLIKK